MNHPVRGIDIDFPWTTEWLGSGGLSTLGAALVTITLNVCVTEASRGSNTVNVMVYSPVSAIDVDVTPIVKAEVILNIPLGIVTAAPPFKM
jgi:hypothetical protein